MPAGSRVVVNAWALGRDPRLWEKADEFIPERFVHCGVDFNGRDFKSVPFGAGRRICPGVNFGVATVEIMLANLVYCFDWDLPAGMAKEDIDMTEVIGLTVRRKEKLLLSPTRSLCDVVDHINIQPWMICNFCIIIFLMLLRDDLVLKDCKTIIYLAN
jgi:cytochrome P450